MSIRTSTRKLWNAFDKARFECDEARRMYGEESEEYKLADKIMDDAYNVYTAFCEWGTRLRGCWFCWNDMQVVKEDRDYMLTLPGVDPDEDLAGLMPDVLTGDLVRLGSPIALDAGLVPPWRLVVANALYFVPLHAPIIIEGAMREDVLDLLTFDPAPDRQALIGASGAASDSAPAGSPLPMAVEVRAPGWKLLGHTRPTGQPPLDAERVWITWRAGA